ncbi:MAG: hypothetical protein ACREYF_23915 [Gammaproteobacteria bacterium]
MERWHNTLVATLLAAVIVMNSAARAASPTLPRHPTEAHLGIVTCAGSTCHGATQPSSPSRTP